MEESSRVVLFNRVGMGGRETPPHSVTALLETMAGWGPGISTHLRNTKGYENIMEHGELCKWIDWILKATDVMGYIVLFC